MEFCWLVNIIVILFHLLRDIYLRAKRIYNRRLRHKLCSKKQSLSQTSEGKKAKQDPSQAAAGSEQEEEQKVSVAPIKIELQIEINPEMLLYSMSRM